VMTFPTPAASSSGELFIGHGKGLGSSLLHEIKDVTKW
jgi:hypothetical protein